LQAGGQCPAQIVNAPRVDRLAACALVTAASSNRFACEKQDSETPPLIDITGPALGGGRVGLLRLAFT
jgi:hypothetical protein